MLWTHLQETEDLEGWGCETDHRENHFWDAAWAKSQHHRPPSKFQFRHWLKPERGCRAAGSFRGIQRTWKFTFWAPRDFGLSLLSLGLQSQRMRTGRQMPGLLSGWHQLLPTQAAEQSSLLLTQSYARPSGSSLQKTGSVWIASFSVTFFF